MSANPLPEEVLRCTTKLLSSLELSFQLRLMLLDETVVASKSLGENGTVGAGVLSLLPQEATNTIKLIKTSFRVINESVFTADPYLARNLR